MTLTFSPTPPPENAYPEAVTPLTAAQLKRRAKFAALVKSLAPNAGHFCTPLNTGPLRVKRATGVFGSV